ncbi:MULTISPECIES: hypothetical protein [Clostridium]|uniref:Uncharacterized protein n=1 Tax=Clostridium carnis TaxID=1530 RepID=A0ABY6SSY8_9CLOT|nr:hypothetical protein [Clostridium carnis]CAI3543063.1 conserved hypothetical protein [Clostridium neonatale]CAI3561675.1 conserved hypothetical protein [Clostridium neonatale]CAI3562913.1 conserved hypothetical protein [Clostridium neonatale]CAI3583918.1 conserved hypothetical protein [Clostridium neonatale]CAI3623631.1 conserved hypothetical protein [Clostridium neonatale]
MDNNKIESLLLQIIKTQESIQSDVTEIKNKINSVYDQTADLTEFRTQTKDNFNSILKDVKFIKHKLHETEEDVFDIKDHLKIIK